MIPRDEFVVKHRHVLSNDSAFADIDHLALSSSRSRSCQSSTATTAGVSAPTMSSSGAVFTDHSAVSSPSSSSRGAVHRAGGRQGSSSSYSNGPHLADSLTTPLLSAASQDAVTSHISRGSGGDGGANSHISRDSTTSTVSNSDNSDSDYHTMSNGGGGGLGELPKSEEAVALPSVASYHPHTVDGFSSDYGDGGMLRKIPTEDTDFSIITRSTTRTSLSNISSVADLRHQQLTADQEPQQQPLPTQAQALPTTSETGGTGSGFTSFHSMLRVPPDAKAVNGTAAGGGAKAGDTTSQVSSRQHRGVSFRSFRGLVPRSGKRKSIEFDQFKHLDQRGAAIVAAFLALVFGVIAMCVGWSSIHLESLDEILIPGVGVVVHPLLPMSLISGEIVPRHCAMSRVVVLVCLSVAYVGNLACVFCWSHSMPRVALPSILISAALYLVCVFVWSMACHNYLRAALISDPIVFDAGLYLVSGSFILCCAAVCLWYWQPKLAPTFASLADAAFANSSSPSSSSSSLNNRHRRRRRSGSSSSSSVTSSAAIAAVLVSSPVVRESEEAPRSPSKERRRSSSDIGGAVPCGRIVEELQGEDDQDEEAPMTMPSSVPSRVHTTLTRDSTREEDAQFERIINT